MALAKKETVHNGEFEIVDGDGNGTGVVWQIQSRNAPFVKGIERKVMQRGAAGALAGGEDIKNLDKSATFIESFLDGNVQVMAACVTGWDWNGEEFYEGEGEPEFSQKNVQAILASGDADFILAQLSEAVDALGKPKAKPKKD